MERTHQADELSEDDTSGSLSEQVSDTSPKLTNTAQCETPDSHMRDASAVSCVQITIPFEVMCP